MVCGPRKPWHKVTNLEPRVTCPACMALRAAFRKSGKARGALAGAR